VARAKRHYIPGRVWHITHRCHKREFLLGFEKDRRRWMQWLFEAKKRYGLIILDFVATSNHVHLLVVDDGERDTIPRSIQLVAGRTGQEYNERKRRKGAFWEDRYHATAVETGEHLLKCSVYIDLNMVRAGVVDHPSKWDFGGYKEIQEPRRRCIVVNYEKLAELTGYDDYDAFRFAHKAWVESSLAGGVNAYDSRWTRSIAVGGLGFIEKTKERLGWKALGRRARDVNGGYELREELNTYIAFFGPKKNDIGTESVHFWE
jgi:putative transposase